MKKFLLIFITFVLILISLSGCFSYWQGDSAELIISVSGANRSTVYNPTATETHKKLDHEVTLTRGKETLNFTFKAGEALEVTLSPGNWNVRVDSYLGKEIYATGSKDVVLKLGQNYATIDMENAILVSFDANKGSGTINPIVIKVNRGSTTLPDGNGFSRIGYTFDSWNTKADGSGTTYRAGSTYTNNSNNKSNITMYAQWVLSSTLKNVTFNSVSANGGTSQTTTQLTLTFNQAITGLTAADITLSGVSGVNKGTLSGSGPTYTLSISGFTVGGTLNVAVSKSGYTISGTPKTITIYYYSGSSNTTVAFSGVTANGDSTTTTTQLTLTFDKVITGLTAADITLSSVSGVNKGTLSGSGPTYYLQISEFTTGGNLTVAVSKSGYNISGSPKTVDIYYYVAPQPPSGWTLVDVTNIFGNEYPNNTINCIAYGENMFVAGGNDGKMAYSEDGITWTAVTNSTFDTNDRINAIAYGNGTFVAVSSNCQMAYSKNGINWTVVTDSTFSKNDGYAQIFSITWGKDKFVAVGRKSEYNSHIAYSLDGETWMTAYDGYGYGIQFIAYGNDKFVAIWNNNSSGQVMYSGNGIDWTIPEENFITSKSVEGITWGSNGSTVNLFVIVTYGSYIHYSEDGLNWTMVLNNTFIVGPTNASIDSIAWGNNKFVAGSNFGETAYSSNGKDWTASDGIHFSIRGIAWGKDKFVAIGRVRQNGILGRQLRWTRSGVSHPLHDIWHLCHHF